MRLKKLAVLVLVAALLLPMCLHRIQADPTDTVYVRKHVSMVYDNSGSMSAALNNAKNLKWTYASYATQIFAGLLNDTDSLTMTLMNPKSGVDTLEVDLSADRQAQVDKLLSLTNYAKGGTPLNSLVDAEKVLTEKGLLSDEQIGNSVISKSEQFWLVLTTDGRFENGTVTKEELEITLEELLKKYSNLQLVYFGIGTEGDTSDQQAYDLRESDRLKAYANFTPVYAEKQDQIVTTMQDLANRISGRYSVSQGIVFDGAEVTVRVSGETSPIRNMAILAQNTNAKLLSAEDEDGNPLIVNRPASHQYPVNNAYDNMPSGTKGAHTALLTNPDGKFSPGTVKLVFSEPVNQQDFSLMYEPAVYVQLTLQQKDASGNWVDVPYGQKVPGGAPLRVSYEILEDGTNQPLDAAKLPGVITDQITCGNQKISRDTEFTAPAGNSVITAVVSMMDGAYTVSTVRQLQTLNLNDYTFQISDPLSFYPDELAANTDQHIEFKVLFEGKPATADQLTDFSINAGDLQGMVTTPGGGVFRFTPRQENRAPGEMQVELCFGGKSVASQKVTVKELIISYAATAGDSMTLFSNEVAANVKPIVFTVTRTRGTVTGPLPEEEAGDFTVEAKNADGTVLGGVTTFSDGQLRFVPNDAAAPVGDYTVTLYRQGVALATAQVSILQYNAQFTAEVFRVGDGKLDMFRLADNESALAFVIYADGVPCTATQLQSMAGTILQLQHDGPEAVKLDITYGTHDGKPAIIARPTTGAGNWLSLLFQRMDLATRYVFGTLKDGPLTMQLTVQAAKGTQISGALDMTHDPADVIKYVIIAALLLILAVLILLVLLANMAMPRICRGTVICYTGQVDKKGNVIFVDSTKELKRVFYPKLTWAAQRYENVDGLSFVAEDREYFTKDTPICLLPNDENLSRYRYNDSQSSVEKIMRTINRHYGQSFPLSDIRDDLGGVQVGDNLTEEDKYCRQHMSDGSCVIYEHGSILNIWIYMQGRQKQQTNEENSEY